MLLEQILFLQNYKNTVSDSERSHECIVTSALKVWFSTTVGALESDLSLYSCKMEIPKVPGG